MPTWRSGWLLFFALISPAGVEARAGETRSFSAKVMESESGKPVLNARVRVERFVHPDPNTGARRVLRVTEHSTNEVGIYRFDFSSDELSEPRLGVILHVRHPGCPPDANYFYNLQNALRNLQYGDALSFDTSLDPGSAISGRVVASDGSPVAGVVVHSFSFLAPDAKPGLIIAGFPDDIRTDEQGRFRFVVRTPGEVDLKFYSDKYAVTAHKITGNKRGDLGRFALAKGQPITGKVVDLDGRPMSGVRVNAKGVRDKSAGKPSLSAPWTNVSGSTITGPDGGFVFAPMSPGSYRVIPVEFDRDPVLGETLQRLPAAFAPTLVTIKSGEVPKPIKVRAQAGITVEARFFDSKGQPRSSPTFQLAGRLATPERRGLIEIPQIGEEDDGSWLGQSWADASGKIIFQAPRGLVHASIFLNNFSLDERQFCRYRIGRGTPLRNDSRVEFDDVDRDFKGIEIVSFESPTVFVKAITEDGSKIKEIRVTASYLGSQRSEEQTTLGSGPRFVEQADGRFRSQRILPDEAVAITIQADGFSARTETLQLPEGAVKEVELILRR